MRQQLKNFEGQPQERDGQLTEETEQLSNAYGELQAEADKAKDLQDLVNSLEKQLNDHPNSTTQRKEL